MTDQPDAEAPPDRLAYFEWSAPAGSELDDPHALWLSNPAMATGRITAEFTAIERAAMDDEEFARERLGIFPEMDQAPRWLVISEAAWTGLAHELTEPWIVGRPTFAVEATVDQSWASLGAAGQWAGDPDVVAVEVGHHRPGMAWLVPELVRLWSTHDRPRILIDPRGPAGSIVRDLTAAGVTIVEVTGSEYAFACASLVEGIDQSRLAHHMQSELDAAVATATKRQRGDSWLFERRHSDVTPLAAVTLARWGHLDAEAPPPAEWDLLFV